MTTFLLFAFSSAGVGQQAEGNASDKRLSIQNASADSASRLGSLAQNPDRPGTFEGYVSFDGAGAHSFYLTDAQDASKVRYGSGGNDALNTAPDASPLTVPEPGYYELFADLNANTWTATRTTWSFIGDATPGGWQTDTPMIFDPAKQTWTATAEMKRTGAFKFRANGAWKIDFGINDAGDLQYADNPHLPYDPSLHALGVHTDGTYTITLDLHRPGSYTYSVNWR